MLRSDLKIMWRNLRRFKTVVLINVVGLAIGLACFIVLSGFVRDELAYDRYHVRAKDVYRVTAEANVPGKMTRVATTPAPLGPYLVENYAEVQNSVRFLSLRSRVSVAAGDKIFWEERFFYSDPTVFDVFTFPLLRGDARTALREPLSLVISEGAAVRYFGREDPVGRRLRVNDRREFTITAVAKNLPSRSHFRFDFLAPFQTLIDADPARADRWTDLSYHTYIQLRAGFSPGNLEKKFPDLVKQAMGPELAPFGVNLEKVTEMFKFGLQPLTKIHLTSHLEGEIEPNGNLDIVYIFSAVALLLLLVACINFMNLATARASTRAREVGLRKVVGAARRQLIRQFLRESLLLASFALLLALCLVELCLPLFRALSGKDLSLLSSGGAILVLELTGLTFVVGLSAGIYPAFFLSAFKPLEVLKGRLRGGGKSPLVRSGLVVVQFAVSVVLVVGVVVIHRQIAFVRHKNLGFDKEHLVVVTAQREDLSRHAEALKSELRAQPGVLAVAASSSLPGRGMQVNTFRPEGAAQDALAVMSCLYVDDDFVSTLGLQLVEGRTFSGASDGGDRASFLVNETAVKKLGWATAVGRRLEQMGDTTGVIIGVVKDFHFASLHEPIEPIVLRLGQNEYRYLSARIRPDRIPETLAFLRSSWKKVLPGRPFEASFLDEDFDRLYRAEMRLEKILMVFAGLAVFVACLGLFGLAAFAAERRTKEIGIRKVLGASSTRLVALLNREFVRCVIVANIVAWPVAAYVMNRWLENFAYRASLAPPIFLGAGALTLVIALVTVSGQALRAARSNPADTLRYE